MSIQLPFTVFHMHDICMTYEIFSNNIVQFGTQPYQQQKALFYLINFQAVYCHMYPQ